MRVHHGRNKTYSYKPQRRGQKAEKKTNTLGWTKKMFALGCLVVVGAFLFPYELPEKYKEEFDKLLHRMNLHVSQINVIGNDRISYDQIVDASGIVKGENIYDVNLADVKAEIEKFSWIENVVIDRRLPSTINIMVHERTPKAIYHSQGKFHLIDEAGHVLQDLEEPTDGFIIVEGPKANLEYSKVLDELYEVEEIYTNIDTLSYVGNRRWNVKTKNGSFIKLPETNGQVAMEELKKLIQQNNILSNQCMIDLRFTPEKIYVKF